MKKSVTYFIVLISFLILTFSFGFLNLGIDNVQSQANPNITLPINFCQGFGATSFPPAGWTISFTGTNYWSWVTQSGFNLGTGSAKYNMWDGPQGTNQSLVTPVFTATNFGDSLAFDIAFCPYSNAQDSLIILTSTNSGATYNSLARLGPSDMQTTTNCSRPFVPVNASDWARRSYILSAGINRIAFLGESDFGDNVYLDSICVIASLVGLHRQETEIPKSFNLMQNYPNPFNPNTVIKYQVPEETYVKLIVYDILGKEIMELQNGLESEGYYTVEFNGDNLSSGIYFYTLLAGNFKQTRSMLLIK
ncbi:MAG: T9SS type A sorting domain-containing protein [Ignavibacteria bacterium]